MDLSAVLRGDFAAWRGLAGDETAPALTAALAPLTQAPTPEERDRRSRTFLVATYDRAAPPARIEAWFPLGSEPADLIEWDDPPAVDLAGTLDRLGPPEFTQTDLRFVADGQVH